MSYTMKAKFLVVVAVVQTGSRLVRLAWGTKISGLAMVAIEGRARVAVAAAAVPVRKLRRFIGGFLRFSLC